MPCTADPSTHPNPTPQARQPDPRSGLADSKSPLALLETSQFISELRDGLATAQQRVRIQVMTFDGDEAGIDIADRLIDAAQRGVDVRVVIDSFADHVVSDTRCTRHDVHDEFQATQALYGRLRASGVSVVFTHPFGPLNVYAPMRNHKKIFIIDDTLYLGGVNIADHNFRWHDLMLRVQHPAVVAVAAEDFDDTVAGQRTDRDESFEIGPGRAIRLITNRHIEECVDELIAGATEEVIIASPYAEDRALCRTMARSTARYRTLIVPQHNNMGLFRILGPYIRTRLRNDGVHTATYRDFSHAKFVLVDNTHLVIGSSNFGRHSYWCNQEICLHIEDPDLVARYRATLLNKVEPLTERLSPARVALGAATSHAFAASLAVLRQTLAGSVPPLATR